MEYRHSDRRRAPLNLSTSSSPDTSAGKTDDFNTPLGGGGSGGQAPDKADPNVELIGAITMSCSTPDKVYRPKIVVSVI